MIQVLSSVCVGVCVCVCVYTAVVLMLHIQTTETVLWHKMSNVSYNNLPLNKSEIRFMNEDDNITVRTGGRSSFQPEDSFVLYKMNPLVCQSRKHKNPNMEHGWVSVNVNGSVWYTVNGFSQRGPSQSSHVSCLNVHRKYKSVLYV